MMETTAGPAGVATANDAVGRLSPLDTAAAESYLGIGGGLKGTRRVTEEGDNEDEEGGFRMGGPGGPGRLPWLRPMAQQSNFILTCRSLCCLEP